MKYRVSDNFFQALNALEINSTILNNCRKAHEEITEISVIAYRDKFLTKEQIFILREAIGKSLIYPGNPSSGLWKAKMDLVYFILESCDKTIGGYGCQDLKGMTDFEIKCLND